MSLWAKNSWNWQCISWLLPAKWTKVDESTRAQEIGALSVHRLTHFVIGRRYPKAFL